MTEPIEACGGPSSACGLCRGTGCTMADTGYIWCRPCEETHRPPECPIDEQGRALRWCGHPLGAHMRLRLNL